MNRIKEISFGDSIAVLEPGVITADLQDEARERQLFYPPDPASRKDCTIGGNVATNAGGPRCLKYGVTRNYVIGLEVVLASGDVLRTGGRVHKNKTGFDLIGLFVGSEGMLGVVTEITVRLLPLPPARATLSAVFGTMTETAATVQAIFQAGFLPAALEIADRFTLEAARLDKGASHVPAGLNPLRDICRSECDASNIRLGGLELIHGGASPSHGGVHAWLIRSRKRKPEPRRAELEHRTFCTTRAVRDHAGGVGDRPTFGIQLDL